MAASKRSGASSTRWVRGDEYEYEDEDEPVEVVPGSADGAMTPEELGDALLELALAIVKLKVLLAEADFDQWHSVEHRLAMFWTAVDSLPRQAPKKRRIGFGPDGVATKKRQAALRRSDRKRR